VLRPEGMDSEVRVYRTPSRQLPQVSHLKQLGGLVAFVSTVIGTLLALGIIKPLGGTQDALAAAASNTTDAGSAEVALRMDMTSAGQTLKATGEGELDFRTGRGKMTYHYPPESFIWNGSPDVKAIFDGLVAYMHLPGVSPERPWVRFDFAALGEAEGIAMAELAQLGSGDPSQMLEYLKAGGDVETVGEELLFGVPTTRYRTTVDLAQVIERAPEGERELLRASVERIERLSGASTMPVEVWVDENDLVRRLSMEQSIPATAGGPGQMTMTMDLFEFGTDVDVRVPPPSRVTDLTELVS
jgi:hypothetical protein